jgi:predicted dehydrogenase
VLGIDFDAAKLALAREFGAETVDLSRGEDPVAAGLGAFSRGRGVDAVIITASTQSNEPMHQAAQMCRKRGRIVLVGVTGLELSRADFFEKELSFQVSCSYGPGRYDAEYEEKGHDYPVGFVRWTEQRNFEAALDMMATGRLDVRPLVTHRFPIAEAEKAYALLGGGEPSLGILLTYPTASEQPESELRRATVQVSATAGKASSGVPVLGLIGSGNYATAVLIPAVKAAGVRLKSVASAQGVSGLHAARKFGIEAATTDADAVMGDADVNAVVITTRHDSHARFVLMALERGKHVFVEKPLCLTLGELEAIEQAHQAKLAAGQAPLVMVGFNRRFAPQVRKMKDLLGGVSGPKSFVMMVNAGAIPPAHWTQDQAVGGGRIVGEACHFIDLLRFLAGCAITECRRNAMSAASSDTVTLQLAFADGSIGTVHYLANGSKAFPKERLEVFCAGRVLQLDNFRRLRGYGWPGFSKMNLWRQDKGQRECTAAFVRAIETGGPAPIPFDELIEVARVSILAQQATN